MPVVDKGSKVLVSGANGYIAMWIIRILLERGFTVRGTVRNEAKGKFLIDYFKSLGYDDKFEVVVVDDFEKVGNWCLLTIHLTWSWIQGRSIWRGSQGCKCDWAYCVANPGLYRSQGTRSCAKISQWFLILVHIFNILWFSDDQPRCSGDTRYTQKRIEKRVRIPIFAYSSLYWLLSRSQVQRIVITSSAAAVSSGPLVLTKPAVFSEQDWNLGSIKEFQEKGNKTPPITLYCASKTLAEKGGCLNILSFGILLKLTYTFLAISGLGFLWAAQAPD